MFKDPAGKKCEEFSFSDLLSFNTVSCHHTTTHQHSPQATRLTGFDHNEYSWRLDYSGTPPTAGLQTTTAFSVGSGCFFVLSGRARALSCTTAHIFDVSDTHTNTLLHWATEGQTVRQWRRGGSFSIRALGSSCSHGGRVGGGTAPEACLSVSTRSGCARWVNCGSCLTNWP